MPFSSLSLSSSQIHRLRAPQPVPKWYPQPDVILIPFTIIFSDSSSMCPPACAKMISSTWCHSHPFHHHLHRLILYVRPSLCQNDILDLMAFSSLSPSSSQTHPLRVPQPVSEWYPQPDVILIPFTIIFTDSSSTCAPACTWIVSSTWCHSHPFHHHLHRLILYVRPSLCQNGILDLMSFSSLSPSSSQTHPLHVPQPVSEWYPQPDVILIPFTIIFTDSSSSCAPACAKMVFSTWCHSHPFHHHPHRLILYVCPILYLSGILTPDVILLPFTIIFPDSSSTCAPACTSLVSSNWCHSHPFHHHLPRYILYLCPSLYMMQLYHVSDPSSSTCAPFIGLLILSMS